MATVSGRLRSSSTAGRATPARTTRASCATTSAKAGCCPIADCEDRQRVLVRGVLRTVTLRPRGGVPALEAELYDGTSVLTVIWLGRRRIAGIEPGRAIQVQGRIGRQERAPGDVQPPLRAALLVMREKADQQTGERQGSGRPSRCCTSTTSARHRRGRRARPALPGDGRPSRHDRGRRAHDHVHVDVHRDQGDPARDRAEPRGRRGHAAGAARAAQLGAVRPQRAVRHRRRHLLRVAGRPQRR